MKILSIVILIVSILYLPVMAQDIHKDFKLIVRDRGVRVSPGLTETPVKIAFATPLKQVSDYWRRSIDSFKGRMDEIGLTYEVYEFSTKIDESRKLRECIQLALIKEPDYLVVTLNDPGDQALISRLLNNMEIKIIVQNVTHPLSLWKENPPFLYVGFDQTLGSEKLAGEFIRRFEGFNNITYAMLYHIEGNLVSSLRGDHFNEFIRNRTDFKLVAEYYTSGDRETSYKAAISILKSNNDLDFIYACSTDIAFGVLDALKETNKLGSVVVNGWGGGADELQSLLKGELDFTVMRMNDDNGVAMAESILLDIQSLETPDLYSGDMMIVTNKSDINFIEELKLRSFRYSGN